MSKVAIIFPGSESLTAVLPEYECEFQACIANEVFDPVLYNHRLLADEGIVEVNKPASSKSQYFFLRCPVDCQLSDDIMNHGFRRFGYYPASGNPYSYDFNDSIATFRYGIEDFLPKRIRPYHRYLRRGSGTYGWFPDSWTYKSELPLIAKSSQSVFRDASGDIHVFAEPFDYETIDALAGQLSQHELSYYTDTFYKAPYWFEEFLDIESQGVVPVEWCLFSFEGREVYLCPKNPVTNLESFPKPPSNLTAKLSCSDFVSTDLALSSDGKWYVLKEQFGCYARIPNGGSESDFYEALAKAIATEDVPEWCWCPVGYIVETHKVAKGKKTVKGSRHFSAGSKVYMTAAFFGQGAERCTVIGVPKYSDHVIGVVIDTELIDHFELEKVEDREVLRAMFLNRLRERFDKPRKTDLLTYWSYNEKDKEDVLRFIESYNKSHRRDS